MCAPRQWLAAHATRKALHVKDQAGHRPHHQLRAADLHHASRALYPEDFLVIGTAVELEVAYETRVRQHRAAGRAREAIFVIIPLGDPHHILVGDGAATVGADRLQKTGLRLHRNGRFCGINGDRHYRDLIIQNYDTFSCIVFILDAYALCFSSFPKLIKLWQTVESLVVGKGSLSLFVT